MLLTPKSRGFFVLMFTGIVTHTGKIVDKSKAHITIKADEDFLERIEEGTSVAIDGICLTVVHRDRQSFAIHFMPETAKKTNIQYLKIGDLVNLELPATAHSFLSGHIVYGHIDTTATVQNITRQGNSRILTFSIAPPFSKYIVQKGAIAVNGVSLTVIEIGKKHFTLGIIPYTWEKTMIHRLKKGDAANIEIDVLAKYLEKFMGREKA